MMRSRQIGKIAGVWIVLLGILPAGCHRGLPGGSLLPAEPALPGKPLILHCDFRLPQRQRLIDQLVRQRSVLHEKLNIPFSDEPVHVTLFASEQAYYEFLSQQFPNFPPRRALFVETNAQRTVYAHWGDHMVEDLRHEVTHGYLHSALPRIPLWLDEGLAEYFEVGQSQHGLHWAHVAFLLQKLQTSAWHPDLVRLEALDSSGKMTQQDYAESWAWVHFLLETSEQRQQLLAQYVADLQKFQAAKPLSIRLGKQLARADLALIEHLESLSRETVP